MRITADGAAKVTENLRAMAARMRDLSPVMAVGAAELQTLVDDSFQQQRSPDGTPWAPHAASTAKRRGPGARILIKTARLRSSVVVTSGPRSITLGTNVGYAAPNQLGSRTAPARPFFPVDGAAGRYVFMDRGPAGAALARIRDRIRAYIRTGSMTG